ncbi:MAG: helix-turn-helix domain-containing protein, partial [Candidatus Falkowbacteria bacterium]
MTSKITKDLICSIFNAGQVLRERAREESNLTDCSFLHMHTLHYIQENGASNMKEIANFLHITPPSATSLVNSLVK